jgi:hypothetical protein
MPRKPRPLDRDGGVVRDATLIVIASEDTHAVKNYLDLFRARRVQFRVLPTVDGQSSPKHLIDRLDEDRKTVDYGEGDEFWISLDGDRWLRPDRIATLTNLVQLCRQKQYRVALCSPCFEFWLLLHFVKPVGIDYRQCRSAIDALRQAAGGYQKQRVDNLGLKVELVHAAIDRARQLEPSDGTAEQDLPEYPVARFHLIVESLLQREAIDLRR